ncbi:MAG: Quinolinate phosphoribosyl transferase [Methanomicrobiales archaeon 53_19]|nr:MAG: Quinolinate phosphoribosyl transferase [Methanomicrobiales archaeon 53_19]
MSPLPSPRYPSQSFYPIAFICTSMSRFGSLDPDLIQSGGCTDIYFPRCEAVLEKAGVNPFVVMEVSVASLPLGFGILAGLDSVMELFDGKPVTVFSMPEGSIFYEGEPVMVIEGYYRDIARFETALLGFLCHASGIATAAAHIAAALNCEEMILITDVPGILTDVNDENSLIREVSIKQIDELISGGVVKEGMVPKVEACRLALNAGVRSTYMLGGKEAGNLLRQILDDNHSGTRIVKG